MANQGDSRHNLGNNVWLETLLTRNAGTAYLRNYGSPRDAWMFRQHVPVTNYEELQDGWMDRVTSGEPDVLFSGRPCAYERTGGSSGGAKLIPYSTAGLLDFQSVIGRWLSHVVSNRGITGLVYLATSPATRPRTLVNGIPVGLPDGAYIGEAWGKWLAAHTAVAPELASEPSMAVWRQRTLQSLSNAQTLELISVWSPTFLLRLMDELPPPEALWPQLKLISCWTSGESAAPAAELQARLPHVQIQPKGLLSTECLVTVPDVQDRPNQRIYVSF